MHQKKVDYTNTFCHLMEIKTQKEKKFDNPDFQNWKKRWRKRLFVNNTPKKYDRLMRSVNPIVIPRNHKVEEALNEADQNNLEPLNKLLEVLSKPYLEKKGIFDYQVPSISNKKYQTFCGT